MCMPPSSIVATSSVFLTIMLFVPSSPALSKSPRVTESFLVSLPKPFSLPSSSPALSSSPRVTESFLKPLSSTDFSASLINTESSLPSSLPSPSFVSLASSLASSASASSAARFNTDASLLPFMLSKLIPPMSRIMSTTGSSISRSKIVTGCTKPSLSLSLSRSVGSRPSLTM